MKSLQEKELEAQFIAQKVTAADYAGVVKLYQERVYWLVRRMVLNHADADDVTQDIFIRIWEKKHQFKGQSALYTWIYRIATNTTLEHLRREKRKNWIPMHSEQNDRINQMQADVYFSGDEAEIKFQKALQTLPDKQRLVFQMKYFDEMKYEAMSEILDTSVGALKASYHHATQKIKHQLTNHD